jgi:uncharacterized membrane protein YvbJ
MSFCGNCGIKLNEEVNFCPQCGTRRVISSINSPQASVESKSISNIQQSMPTHKNLSVLKYVIVAILICSTITGVIIYTQNGEYYPRR